MKEIIVGVITGIISSFIVSEIYRRKEDNREKRLNFINDQQMFSKYIGVIINELELYEATGNNEYLLRTLNKPKVFYSFTEKNLSEESLNIIASSNNLLDNLEQDLKQKEKLSKSKLVEYNAELFRAELNVLKIKLIQK